MQFATNSVDIAALQAILAPAIWNNNRWICLMLFRHLVRGLVATVVSVATAAAAVVATAAAVALALSGPAFAAEKFRTFWRGQWVDYVEIGDYAITEGDIIIGQKDDVREWARAVERGQMQVEATRKALALDSAARVWNVRDATGVVQVPYTVAEGNRSNIDAAIAEANRALAGVVRWVARGAETDYVEFNLATKDAGSCASFVGRIGGKQNISGDPECSIATIVHEMGHAMGLWHVQQDARANAFVDFRLANMDASKRSNNQPIFGTRTWGGYDYESNMHYSRIAFSASSADRQTLETKPPGISAGTSPTYSTADLDALFRLYGKTPSQTTVQSNPAGLRVVVDGVAYTTPAKFDWPIGSVRRVWVDSGLQSLGGFRYAFGRWSHDASTDPSPQLTWEVRAGDGSFGSPSNAPADTVIVANFVRLIEVQTTPASQAGGTSSVVARRAPWPGSTNLFPQFTAFDLSAQPVAGLAHYFNWGAAFASQGGAGVRTNLSLLLNGALATQTIGANFHNGPTISVDVQGVGVEDGVAVRVTPPGGTVGSTIAPRIARSTAGSWKFDIQSPQFVGTGIRYTREAYEGFDNIETGEVTMPSSGARNVAIRAFREVAPYSQVRPTCAGSVNLSDRSTWLRTGAPLAVSVVSSGAGVFAGWSGTLSGLNTSSNIAVGSNVPEFVAHFNQTTEPLTLATVSPYVIGDDATSTVVELRGAGFTPSSLVRIGNQTFAPTYINSSTLRFTVTRSAFSSAGRLPVFVVNALSLSCQASTNSAAFDVLPLGARASVVLTEYYNPSLDYYFLTGRENEKLLLNGLADWRRTGEEVKLFAVAVEAARPLERFFFANVARAGTRGSHFFTSLAAEQRLLASVNATNAPERAKPFLESIEGYTIDKQSDGSCPAQSTPVYRAFKGAPRYIDDGNHRFSTTLVQHRDMVERLGWVDEGVVFCALL
jgi:Astacin (Peptidase family M12A)